jgi:S1-C subfamily serine protease
MHTILTATDVPNEPPAWAPPPPPMSTMPPSRRRWPRIAAASVALAAVVGGSAGYLGASLAGTGTTVQTPAEVTPLAYTGTLLDVASVIDKVEPSVVTIKTEITVDQGRRSYTGEAAGTGIVLTADGEILTNAHVVADATSITVTLDGETTPRTAVVVGTDTVNDVALIKIVGASGLTPATIGDSSSVAVGDDVVAIGNALDLEGGVTVTRGIVSALDRSIDVENGKLSGLIQTDAAISSGNSGGPLANAAGEIIGMNSAGAASSDSVTAENIGFAIAINQAMAIVGQLRAAA